MAYSQEGIVKEITPLQTGQSANGEWKKRELVIGFKDGNYDKLLAISGMKDKADLIGQQQVGSNVRVHFNLESKESGGRYFCNCNLWKIEVIGGASANATTAPEIQTQGEQSDLPF